MKPTLTPRTGPPRKGDDVDTRGPGLRSLIRKSALLNFGIVLTTLPMAAVGGRDAAFLVGVLLVAVSVFVWFATFAAFSAISLVRIYRQQGRFPRRLRRGAAAGAGLADPWVDGPASV